MHSEPVVEVSGDDALIMDAVGFVGCEPDDRRPHDGGVQEAGSGVGRYVVRNYSGRAGAPGKQDVDPPSQGFRPDRRP
jgi:hypothetical protein